MSTIESPDPVTALRGSLAAIRAEKAWAGKTLRDAGFEQVMDADKAVHRGASLHIRAAIEHLADSGSPFTAEDVRALLPGDVFMHSPNLLPAHIGAAAKDHRIVCVGMAKPSRPSRRASRILIWQGVPA